MKPSRRERDFLKGSISDSRYVRLTMGDLLKSQLFAQAVQSDRAPLNHAEFYEFDGSRYVIHELRRPFEMLFIHRERDDVAYRLQGNHVKSRKCVKVDLMSCA